MKLTQLPSRLARYKDIALLLIKHGRRDLVEQTGLLGALEDQPDATPETNEAARELAADLEKLGPTFIKLGQLLSTRPDLLPPTYLHELARLQDGCEPFSFEEVEECVEKELGVRISKAFDRFDSKPIAAASIAQVHRAELRGGGEVVVKVQRPEIRKQVAEDLEMMEEMAALLDRHTEVGKRYRFSLIVEQFRKTLTEELDFRREARNLNAIGEALAEFPSLIVPQPIDDYSSSRVLTMTYVPGVSIDDLSPVAKIDFDGSELADELFRAYLQQILVDGLFHADPHPGNVLLTRERKIALIDLGMVGRLDSSYRKQILRLLLSIVDSESAAAADQAIEMSTQRQDFDEDQFRRRISDLMQRNDGARVKDLHVGSIVIELCQIAGESGLLLPPELTMLGKTLLHLDEIGAKLDSEFDPKAAIRRHATELTTRRLEDDFSLSRLLTRLLETKDLVERLPGRVNKALELIGENKVRVKVDAIDEQALIVSMQKIANRITSGLVLAALIVGASLMMRIETRFSLFGYPGLAMICFLLAAAGGFWLVWTAMWTDRKIDRDDST